MKPEAVIVGGGAAGLMAAIFAARGGVLTDVYEQNEKPGRKIYITGKGRCNFTNLCSREEFLAKVPRNPRFLYSALAFLSPEDTAALMEEQGCPVKTERGQRAFPASDKASDITKALVKAARAAGARIHTGCRVLSVDPVFRQNASFASCRILGPEGECVLQPGALILATGGLCYPATGSTGDGYRFARETGHSVTACTPSLTGLQVREAWPRSLQGLSLKNVSLRLIRNGKTVLNRTGEMLFTHYGVSGPLVLEASSLISGLEPGEFRLELDMKPGLKEEQLLAKCIRFSSESGRSRIKTFLETMLPRRMAGVVCSLAQLDEAGQMSCLTAAERTRLCTVLKALPMTVEALRPFTESIITRGGVDIRGIDPGTMRSRSVGNLYFAGELIDTDALTGGFNLQIAFSTGALAGHSAAGAILRQKTQKEEQS